MFHINKNDKIILIIVLLSLTFILAVVYYPVMKAPFLLDDYSSIVENSSIYQFDVKKAASYAPMRAIGYISFAVNYALSKQNTFTYHLVNLILHILYAGLVYIFVNKLFETPKVKDAYSSFTKNIVSVSSAVFAAIHPINTFAVSYIVQRLTIIAAVMFLITVILYIRLRLKEGNTFVNIIVLLISVACLMFTKENSITIFPLFILIELILFTKERKTQSIILGTIAAMFLLVGAAAYLNIIDFALIDRMTKETTEITRLEYLYTQFYVILLYICKTILPFNLVLDNFITLSKSFFDLRTILSFTALLSVIVLGSIYSVKKNKFLVIFGIVFFFVTLSVESSIIPIRDVMFIHRIYLPSIGLYIVLFSVFAEYFSVTEEKRKILIGVLLSISLIFAAWTMRYNFIWKEPVKVWNEVIRVYPENHRGYAGLGQHYLYYNKNEEALIYLKKSLELKQGNPVVLNNLGIANAKLKRFDDAVYYFTEAVKIKPDHAKPYINIGAVLLEQNKVDEAEKYIKKAYEINPNSFDVIINLGMIAVRRGDLDNAMIYMEKAESINDKVYITYYVKGFIYMNKGNHQYAIYNLEKSLELNPSFMPAKQLLGRLRNN